MHLRKKLNRKQILDIIFPQCFNIEQITQFTDILSIDCI